MGNWVNYSGYNEDISNNLSLANIPNHLLIDIINSGLNERDVAAFRSVCKRLNWLVGVAPSDRLPKLHVARLGIDCKFEGDDVVWIRQKNCSTVGFIRGHTRDATVKKLKRVTCDEFRLCGHHQPINTDPNSSPTTAVARRHSVGNGDLPNFQFVAVNPTWFTTVLETGYRTLTRIYVFRCSLFRFTDKDISTLAVLENLNMLSICRATDVNAVNDISLLPVIEKGTLEKLVLDGMPITDHLLITMSEKCKKLSLVSVTGCAGVSEQGVAAVTNEFMARDGAKIICRDTNFDYMRFLMLCPRFRLSTSGRALELPQKKISIHFV